MSELVDQVGLLFRKTRYGAQPQVILEAVKRRYVVLREPEHQETFKRSIESFKKFYEPVRPRKQPPHA
jgi:hypothetical protein